MDDVHVRAALASRLHHVSTLLDGNKLGLRMQVFRDSFGEDPSARSEFDYIPNRLPVKALHHRSDQARTAGGDGADSRGVPEEFLQEGDAVAQSMSPKIRSGLTGRCPLAVSS